MTASTTGTILLLSLTVCPGCSGNLSKEDAMKATGGEQTVECVWSQELDGQMQDTAVGKQFVVSNSFEKEYKACLDQLEAQKILAVAPWTVGFDKQGAILLTSEKPPAAHVKQQHLMFDCGTGSPINLSITTEGKKATVRYNMSYAPSDSEKALSACKIATPTSDREYTLTLQKDDEGHWRK